MHVWRDLDNPAKSTTTPAWLGWLAIVTGLALHKWALEILLAPDEHFGSGFFVALIVLFQVGWIGLGAALLWLRSRIRLPSPVTWAATVVMTAVLSLGVYGTLRALEIVVPHRQVRAAWQQVTAAEEVIHILTPELGKLRRSVLNLEFPDAGSRHLFGDPVAFADLPAGEAKTRELATVPVEVREWRTSVAARRAAAADLELWRRLLDRVEYFEHAEFKLVTGHFVDQAPDSFETAIHFAGLARTQDGRWDAVEIDQRVRWQRPRGSATTTPDGPWRIVGWHTERLTSQQTAAQLFTEVLDEVVVDSEDLGRARRSIHEERVREYFADAPAVVAAYPYFLAWSTDRHPGLSVADVDRDGFDDLYVMARWGSNQLLRNRGDGTFEETAEAFGLDVRDHTTSAIFADFDNDGDTDAVLGRSLAPSLYLINEGGRFVDRSATHVDGSLPCLASAVSAADVDRDGLLDVYIATYGAVMQPYLGGNDPGGLIRQCLSEADRRRWRRLDEEQGQWAWNSFGPPNVMLRNLGNGRFETVRLMPDLYRNTLQATWADYDHDGDPDVYLANDFAPNNLLRNDGGGRFSDVTDETGTADLGFGMGASWGDYDNDGHQDLYVSNMFSKAGRRITAGMPGIDPRLPPLSRGNSLLRNDAGAFTRVSGLTPDTLQVEKAGWAWGGQLTDLDNDGFLDVYSARGLVNSPAPWGQAVDL